MKKAQGAILMVFVLVFVIFVILNSMQFHWSKSIEKKAELEFKEDLYVIRNSLKLSKVYLDTSLDYSMYQGMYDVGKNGGWETKKNNLNDNKDEVKNALKKRISANLKNYVERDYNFLGEIIRLPPFNENKITIEELSNGNLNVSTEGERNIYFEEKTTIPTEKKSIRLELSSKLNKVYDFKFFSLHDKAVEVSKGITDCDDKEETSGNYKIVLNANNDAKPCNVTVSVTDTSKEFPVFNSAEVSFEPITFEYSVEIA